MDPEDLENFLNGSQGVAGLDLARAYVAERERNALLQTKCSELLTRCDEYAAVAELHQAEATGHRGRLDSLAEALASMVGNIRDTVQKD